MQCFVIISYIRAYTEEMSLDLIGGIGLLPSYTNGSEFSTADLAPLSGGSLKISTSVSLSKPDRIWVNMSLLSTMEFMSLKSMSWSF